ncbi:MULTISPECIES: heavy-metal-associated domain-containing protein [unclassified Phenylobacterium]|jgi:copper chaperone|uniref:heavy-metal-associated domain-containing protein n=1 Tax=unclassified Phenylobacterium TaxID=2640670 RepID=UPI0009E7B1F9
MGSPIWPSGAPFRRTSRLRYQVEGMSCGHCVQAVARAVKAEDPQAEIAVDLAAKAVSVTRDYPGERIAQAIRDAGYGVAAPVSARLSRRRQRPASGRSRGGRRRYPEYAAARRIPCHRALLPRPRKESVANLRGGAGRRVSAFDGPLRGPRSLRFLLRRIKSQRWRMDGLRAPR